MRFITAVLLIMLFASTALAQQQFPKPPPDLNQPVRVEKKENGGGEMKKKEETPPAEVKQEKHEPRREATPVRRTDDWREGGIPDRATDRDLPTRRSVDSARERPAINDRDSQELRGMVIQFDARIYGIDDGYAKRELGKYVKAHGGRLVFEWMPGVTHTLRGEAKVSEIANQEISGRRDGVPAGDQVVLNVAQRLADRYLPRGRNGERIEISHPQIQVDARQRTVVNAATFAFYVHPLGQNREVRPFVYTIEGEASAQMATETGQRQYYANGGYNGSSQSQERRQYVAPEVPQSRAWLAAMNQAKLEQVADVYRRIERVTNPISDWQERDGVQYFDVVVPRLWADRLHAGDRIPIRLLANGARRANGDAEIIDLADGNGETTISCKFHPRDGEEKLFRDAKYVVELPAKD